MFSLGNSLRTEQSIFFGGTTNELEVKVIAGRRNDFRRGDLDQITVASGYKS